MAQSISEFSNTKVDYCIVIHQRFNAHDRMDWKQFQLTTRAWIFSHYSVHHTVRDEETTVVSLSKIQPNNACQEAGMTFGAVEAIKRL